MSKKQKDVINAVLRTDESKPCLFCGRTVENDLKLGKFYTLGPLSCHHFCALLSSFLVQRGNDNEGMLGFLLEDVQAELHRGKRLKCIYCETMGATLVCCASNCKKRFHLPCGIENGCLPLFYDTFQSFCVKHRLKQKKPPKLNDKPALTRYVEPILQVKKQVYPPVDNYDVSDDDHEEIKQQAENLDTMVSENLEIANIHNRLKRESFWIAATSIMTMSPRRKVFNSPKKEPPKANVTKPSSSTNSTCPICMEDVVNNVTPDTIWPPCCGSAGDRWFHRECLERLALSAGQHYFKCPLCNDKPIFCDAMLKLGIYLPDQDASWEVPGSNWFDSLYRRHARCDADICQNPKGRNHAHKRSAWELLLCATCGSYGCHRQCVTEELGPGSQLCCSICRNASNSRSTEQRTQGYTLRINLWQAPQINYLQRLNEVRMQLDENKSTTNVPGIHSGSNLPGCSSGFAKNSNRKILPTVTKIHNRFPNLSLNRRRINIKQQRRRKLKIHKEAIANLARISVPLQRCDSMSLTTPTKRRVSFGRDVQVVDVTSSDSLMEVTEGTATSWHSDESKVCHVSSDNPTSPSGRVAVVSSTSTDQKTSWKSPNGGFFKLIMSIDSPPIGKIKVRRRKLPKLGASSSSADGTRQSSIADFFKKLPS